MQSLSNQVDTEVLLTPTLDRLILYPLRYEKLWNMYKQAQSMFWVAEDIDLEQDLYDWTHRLTDNERYFVSNILAFFAASDGIVNENLATRFYQEIQIPEARSFYGFQIMMENVHAETYSQQINTYIQSPTERDRLFNAIQTIPFVKKKAEWAMRWINDSDSFAERLIAFACVEGILFSSSFCAIFWLKKRGLMVHGLAKSNEFISRDEGLHRDFACELYGMLKNKLSENRVHEIVKGAIEVEEDFVKNSLPVSLIGMNSDSMMQYVKFCADHLLKSLGCGKIYNVANPFVWMTTIGMETKDNFFETRNSNYTRMNSDDNDDLFDMDDD